METTQYPLHESKTSPIRYVFVGIAIVAVAVNALVSYFAEEPKQASPSVQSVRTANEVAEPHMSSADRECDLAVAEHVRAWLFAEPTAGGKGGEE